MPVASHVHVNALQLLDNLPKEVEYLVVAHLAKDRKPFQAFSLSCKRNTSCLKDSAFWRVALASQGRIVPAEDAEDLKSLICLFYSRVYADDFCCSTSYLLGAKLFGRYKGFSQTVTVSLSSSECVLDCDTLATRAFLFERLKEAEYLSVCHGSKCMYLKALKRSGLQQERCIFGSVKSGTYLIEMCFSNGGLGKLCKASQQSDGRCLITVRHLLVSDLRKVRSLPQIYRNDCFLTIYLSKSTAFV